MPDQDGSVDEVLGVNTSFYEAYESADLDTMQELWLDAPETVCVHPGAAAVHGTGPIRRSWALVMAHTPYIQFVLTDVVASRRDDIASVTCTEYVLTGEVGDSPDSFGAGSGTATNVFVHTPEGWRLWMRHASPILTVESHGDE